MSIFNDYCNAIPIPTDINEHMPELFHYASKCNHVTEFGVRWGGGSTLAFLAGLETREKPATLVSWDYDQKAVEGAFRWLPKLEKTRFELRCGDTLKIHIEETDFLFIDTLHTYDQLIAELIRHTAQVRKYIGFHDTETYGSTGEDGRSPGLLGAINNVLMNTPLYVVEEIGQWKLCHQSKSNNGLMILERIK